MHVNMTIHTSFLGCVQTEVHTHMNVDTMEHMILANLETGPVVLRALLSVIHLSCFTLSFEMYYYCETCV